MTEKTRCKWADSSSEMRKYHDKEYGFRIKDDILYFERLTLEIFQAGLSWQTILKKRPAFRLAFDDFDFRKVAFYKTGKINKLLNDKDIVRNRLKITATIYNANEFINIIDVFGSFDKFLKKQNFGDRELILKLFRKHFKFTGPLIVEEFMMSTGLWKVKHSPDCFLYKPE
jgi:DNA-3-methyladenine glycosylase I